MPTPDDFTDCRLPEYNASRDDSMIPCAIPSKQFSSDCTGNPKELLAQVAPEVQKHSDIVNAYGYNMPVATMGQHPWLRDSLADATEMEPGAAQPKPGLKIPFGKDV
jgi:hypothetical protein